MLSSSATLESNKKSAQYHFAGSAWLSKQNGLSKRSTTMRRSSLCIRFRLAGVYSYAASTTFGFSLLAPTARSFASCSTYREPEFSTAFSRLVDLCCSFQFTRSVRVTRDRFGEAEQRPRNPAAKTYANLRTALGVYVVYHGAMSDRNNAYLAFSATP